MILILGGAYQGKLTWAAEQYNIPQEDCWDLRRGLPRDPSPCLYHLEDLTRAAAASGSTASALLEALLPCLTPDCRVIAREVGSGVVPMDPEERFWRELHGQVIRALAAKSEHVIRIFCGLPEVLK